MANQNQALILASETGHLEIVKHLTNPQSRTKTDKCDIIFVVGIAVFIADLLIVIGMCAFGHCPQS